MIESKADVTIRVTSEVAKKLAARRKWKQTYNEVIWELLWIVERKKKEEEK